MHHLQQEMRSKKQKGSISTQHSRKAHHDLNDDDNPAPDHSPSTSYHENNISKVPGPVPCHESTRWEIV